MSLTHIPIYIPNSNQNESKTKSNFRNQLIEFRLTKKIFIFLIGEKLKMITDN